MSVVDYNIAEHRQGLIGTGAFGAQLAQDVNFKLTSPATYDYNCIAFAMGVDDRWADCADLPWHWWPQQREYSSGLSQSHMEQRTARAVAALLSGQDAFRAWESGLRRNGPLGTCPACCGPPLSLRMCNMQHEDGRGRDRTDSQKSESAKQPASVTARLKCIASA